MTESRDKLRLENIFAAMCLAFVDKMESAFADEADISPRAAAALIQIGTNSGITVESLRQIIALSHSATVRLVDQLVASEYVVRGEALESDKRAKRLELTEKGREVFRRCIEARRAVAERALSSIAPGELSNVGKLAEAILPALVDLGADQDVVCRCCDQDVCDRPHCPITHMR